MCLIRELRFSQNIGAICGSGANLNNLKFDKDKPITQSFLATFMDISDYPSIPMAKWQIGTSGKNWPNPFLEGFGLIWEQKLC